MELLMSVTAGAASIVTGACSASGDVATIRIERHHSAFCTCDQGDTSHCLARDSL